MENDHRNKTGEGKPEIRSRRQIQVFLVCLFIAAFIWLLIKLSKEYSYETTFKVVYTNMPPGKVLSRKSDSLLLLTLKSSGYTVLYRKMFHHHKVIYVDLGQLKLKKNGSWYEGSVQTADLSPVIQSQLPNNERLSAVYPTNIQFRFENAFTKKVPVEPNLTISYHSQYGLYGKISIEPDSIEISGPVHQIDSIQRIKTGLVNLSELRESKYLAVPLIFTNPGLNITAQPDYIRLIIPVAQYTESSVMVNVNADSLTEGYSIKTYPSQVKVVYRVALRDYKQVKSSDFRVSVDASKALQSQGGRLRVEVTHHPLNVQVTRIEPEKVEFILSK